MVEAMIAMSILTVSLIGLFALLTSSFALSRNAINQYVGSGLASEGVEIVRKMINTNFLTPGTRWNDGLLGCSAGAGGGGGCEADYNDSALSAFNNSSLKFQDNSAQPNFGTYSYDSGGDTQFKRQIIITSSPGGDRLTVTSKVTWKDRGGSTSEIIVADEFYNLQ